MDENILYVVRYSLYTRDDSAGYSQSISKPAKRKFTEKEPALEFQQLLYRVYNDKFGTTEQWEEAYAKIVDAEDWGKWYIESLDKHGFEISKLVKMTEKQFERVLITPNDIKVGQYIVHHYLDNGTSTIKEEHGIITDINLEPLSDDPYFKVDSGHAGWRRYSKVYFSQIYNVYLSSKEEFIGQVQKGKNEIANTISELIKKHQETLSQLETKEQHYSDLIKAIESNGEWYEKQEVKSHS